MLGEGDENSPFGKKTRIEASSPRNLTRWKCTNRRTTGATFARNIRGDARRGVEYHSAPEPLRFYKYVHIEISLPPANSFSNHLSTSNSTSTRTRLYYNSPSTQPSSIPFYLARSLNKISSFLWWKFITRMTDSSNVKEIFKKGIFKRSDERKFIGRRKLK